MTINLINAFTAFLKQQDLPEAKLLLMVSGGVDSMVLLHVAQQVVEPKNLVVFHLNHNAREGAKTDANFVQNYCSKNNIECLIETLPGGHLPEAQWRQERQQRSNKARKTLKANRILTAHHATDLVETMVFRLTKGAGPSGLSPFDVTTKPFWQAPKDELIQYAKDHKLEWREDATNQDTSSAQRNLIRHQVLPHLRTITPNLEKVFVREAQTFAETNDFVQSQLKLVVSNLQTSSTSFPLEAFVSLHPILQKEWLRQVAAKTPSQAELDDCLGWLHGGPKGNSEKSIGGAKLSIRSGEIIW